MATQAKSRSESNVSNALFGRMAEKFNVDADELVKVLKATAFRQRAANKDITDEQLLALLIVSDQYNLNPFTKEIHAYPDNYGGIIPVVGIDGWNRIANEHPEFNGVEFVYSEALVQAEGALSPCHAWIETVVYRKDRAYPTRIREYLDECYRGPFLDERGNPFRGPWQTHPKRLLRHKSQIQCYRISLGFVGIYDEDEALRILDAQNADGGSAAKVVKLRQIEPKALEVQPAPTVNDFFEGDFDRVNVDQFLGKLVKRAKATNQWQAAKDLVEDRLQGAAKNYAKQQLEIAQKNSALGAASDARQSGDPQNDDVVLVVEESDKQSEKAVQGDMLLSQNQPEEPLSGTDGDDTSEPKPAGKRSAHF